MYSRLDAFKTRCIQDSMYSRLDAFNLQATDWGSFCARERERVCVHVWVCVCGCMCACECMCVHMQVQGCGPVERRADVWLTASCKGVQFRLTSGKGWNPGCQNIIRAGDLFPRDGEQRVFQNQRARVNLVSNCGCVCTCMWIEQAQSTYRTPSPPCCTLQATPRKPLSSLPHIMSVLHPNTPHRYIHRARLTATDSDRQIDWCSRDSQIRGKVCTGV